MTDRATARHRAPLRAKTPLTTISTGLTSAVSDGVDAVGRSGAVIAVSSSLVASLALPASASQGLPSTTSVTPTTASLPLAEPLSSASGVVAAGRIGQLVSADALAAPTSTLTLTAPAQLAATPLAGSDLLAGSPLTAAAGAAVAFDSGALSTSQVSQALANRTVERASRASSRAAVKAAAKAAKAPAKAATAPGKAAGKAAGKAVAGNRAAMGATVLSIASRYVGIYYRYGGTTPRGFDCSGFVRYVYNQIGAPLPRTAHQQMNAGRRISREEARPGDLVFTVRGGYATHVGIYAGGGMMYDSPRTGKAISKRKIWTSSPVYVRVLG